MSIIAPYNQKSIIVRFQNEKKVIISWVNIILTYMKRIDLLIGHERLHEVNELLRDHKVGGLTSYDIKGRGRAKNEPIAIGRGVMRYIPEFGSRTMMY